MNRPLVCVRDDALLDELLRLAAAAGCELDRAADVTAVRAAWRTAPLILLDVPSALSCRDFGLSRRRAVVVVVGATPDDSAWEASLALGAERLVSLPDAESWLVNALADAVEAPAGVTGRVLAVIGGRGGAGASVFAAATGHTALCQGRNAMLVDCDPLSGGLDLVFGAEHDDGLRWPQLTLSAGRVAVSALHERLPGRSRGSARLTIMSGARTGEGPAEDAVAAVIDAGRRAGETVICDLPRDPGPAALAALSAADLTTIIVPAELRACVSAGKIAARLADHSAPAAVVVRGPAPGDLRAKEIAESIGLPLLADMRADPRVDHLLDQGRFTLGPKSPLARAATAVLAELHRRPP